MLRMLPPTNQACPGTNEEVAGWEKLSQKVETTSTFCSKLFTYMLRVSLAQGKLVLQHAWRDFRLILSNQKSVFTQIC